MSSPGPEAIVLPVTQWGQPGLSTRSTQTRVGAGQTRVGAGQVDPRDTPGLKQSEQSPGGSLLRRTTGGSIKAAEVQSYKEARFCA